MTLHPNLNGFGPEELPQFNFHARYERMRDHEQNKNALIDDLLTEFDQLTARYTAIALDREREVQYNRAIQQQLLGDQAEIKRLRGIQERNPFILILLDGDGMIFQDHLLQQGEQGGKEAAGYLWNAVRNYIEREFPAFSSTCKIVARIYGNTKGLAETCYKAGIVEKSSKVEEFLQGFTRSKHLFDFVDVGSGKDRADEKLSEVFKLHLFDCHCRQILFGGSHDNGYARLLEEFTTDEVSKNRITLLEGFPFEREMEALRRHFRTTKFDTLFRSSKIVASQHQSGYTSLSSSNPYHGGGSGGSMTNLVPTNVSSNPVPQSWASAAMTLPAVAASSSPTSQSTQSSLTIPRNRRGQRVDPEVRYDKYDIKRVKALKLCNVHYLRGDCGYGSDCTHAHDYKPSTGELACVRYIARLAPCRMGTECEDPKCIYGHRCPAGTPCSFGDSCRFPDEMHNIDLVVVRSTKVT